MDKCIDTCIGMCVAISKRGRSELIDIVNRANTTWRAGVNARFAGLPIGVSASLCGVKNTSRIELVALVASGVVPLWQPD